jgi:hypothetical protein
VVGRLREAAVVGIPAVIMIVLGYRQRWAGDDGMICTRTVRQVLAGHGPLFNTGERAEASTGTLWQWLVAAGTVVTRQDPAVVAVTSGIVLTGAGYALAVAAARRAVRPMTTAPLLPLGMLVLTAVKADWDYATSGLENGLSTAWIALAWWCLVGARTPPYGAGRGHLCAAAAVIGLGPLIRPVSVAAAGLAVWALCCALLWRPAASSGSPYTILDEQPTYSSYTHDPHPITQAVHAGVPSTFRPAVLAARAAGKPVLLMESPEGGGRIVTVPLAHRTGDRLAGAWGLLGNNGIVVPLDGTAVDTLGLACPLAAHQERAPGRTSGRSGHEKPVDPAWIVADYTDPGTAVPGGLDPARVTAARHALRCGPLAELQASVRAPLTADRFWRNLSGAWTRTGFRYPGDPVAAERALCRS